MPQGVAATPQTKAARLSPPRHTSASPRRPASPRKCLLLRMAASLLLLLLLSAQPPAGSASAGEQNVFSPWVQAPVSLPDGLVPEGLIYGADRFLSIGSVGKNGNPVWFGLSTDGASWIFTQVIPPQELRQVVYGDGRFLAHWAWEGVGDVATSPDGVSWTLRGFIPFPDFRKLLYGQGRFVGIGRLGEVLTSTDGLTWQLVPGAPWRDQNPGWYWLFTDLTFTGSSFITAGEAWDGNGNVVARGLFTSDDGLTWSVLTSSPPACAGQVAYGNGRYLLLGGSDTPGIATSEDGQTWTPCTVPEPGFVSRWLHAMEGYFVLPDGAAQRLFLSIDGITWWAEPLPADAGRILAYQNGRAVLIGPEAIYTADFAQPGIFTVGRLIYTAHGQSLSMDVAPFIQESRTFVPVRYLAEMVGVPPGGIRWDDATQTVTLTRGSDVVELRIGSKVMWLNGEPQMMDVAPLLLPPGRTMLPARFVAQAFGYRVEWFEQSQMVLIRR